MTESSAPEGEMPTLPEPAHYIATEARSRGMYPAYRNLQARKQFAPQGEFQFSFTAKQMHAYAREYAATSAAQAASGGAEPVAWRRREAVIGEDLVWVYYEHKPQYFDAEPLYAAPDHPSPSREGPSDAEMLAFLLAHCKVVYYPTGSGYPVEHNPFALGYPKDGAFLLGALRAAMKVQHATSLEAT